MTRPDPLERLGVRIVVLTGVAIDVLLTGELGDLEHHLIGHRSERAVSLRRRRVALRSDRPADGNRTRADQFRRPGVGRLDPVGPDDPDGIERRSHLEGQARRPRAPFVQPPIPAARPLGEDAEQLTAAQDVLGRVEREGGLRPSRTIDGDHPHRREQVLRLPRRHVLGLADEADVARHGEHQEGGIEERDVIRAQDRRAFGRQPVETSQLDVPDPPGEGREDPPREPLRRARARCLDHGSIVRGRCDGRVRRE